MGPIGSGLVILIAAVLLIILFPNLSGVYDKAAKHFKGTKTKKKNER